MPFAVLFFMQVARFKALEKVLLDTDGGSTNELVPADEAKDGGAQ